MSIPLPSRPPSASWIFALTCLALTPLASTGATMPAQFGADTRLSRSIQTEQVGGSLEELLDSVSDEAGVRLKVSSPLASRPLVAPGTNGSVGRLQTVLGTNWTASWTASKDSLPNYLLGLSEDDKKT